MDDMPEPSLNLLTRTDATNCRFIPIYLSTKLTPRLNPLSQRLEGQPDLGTLLPLFVAVFGPANGPRTGGPASKFLHLPSHSTFHAKSRSRMAGFAKLSPNVGLSQEKVVLDTSLCSRHDFAQSQPSSLSRCTTHQQTKMVLPLKISPADDEIQSWLLAVLRIMGSYVSPAAMFEELEQLNKFPTDISKPNSKLRRPDNHWRIEIRNMELVAVNSNEADVLLCFSLCIVLRWLSVVFGLRDPFRLPLHQHRRGRVQPLSRARNKMVDLEMWVRRRKGYDILVAYDTAAAAPLMRCWSTIYLLPHRIPSNWLDNHLQNHILPALSDKFPLPEGARDDDSIGGGDVGNEE
ncbi:hypothetical protein C8J56DRAFT_1026708 [Mycena floridula]|nr:hypothetical protein C8J56DRAFT_1026708 [Mycena floridula]